MLRVKELREGRGMTQEDVSRLSGLSVGTVRRIENNRNQPNGRTLKALATALNVSIGELFGERVA
jgi:transcriptional regulator with XRE-family HTH domain